MDWQPWWEYLRATVASWEIGRRTPDIQAVNALARIFGTTTDYLLDHHDPSHVKEPTPHHPTNYGEAAIFDPGPLQGRTKELWDLLLPYFLGQKTLSAGQLKAIVAILSIDE